VNNVLAGYQMGTFLIASRHVPRNASVGAKDRRDKGMRLARILQRSNPCPTKSPCKRIGESATVPSPINDLRTSFTASGPARHARKRRPKPLGDRRVRDDRITEPRIW